MLRLIVHPNGRFLESDRGLPVATDKPIRVSGQLVGVQPISHFQPGHVQLTLAVIDQSNDIVYEQFLDETPLRTDRIPFEFEKEFEPKTMARLGNKCAS